VVIEAIYTSPQLAQVGLTASRATAEERAVTVHRASYREALKPRLTDEPVGFVKVLADAGDGRVLGAGAVGERAAEILSPVAVAIAAGMRIGDLAAWFPAYPTLAELVGIAARGY
jgi:dihydrolipoamide dehydrogenase